MPRPRLLPLALVGMLALLGVKLESLWPDAPASGLLVSQAVAQASPPAPPPAAPVAAVAPTVPPPADQVAERAVLEALRARRTDIEARDAALAQREMLIAAAERRLADRLDELGALRQRLEAESRQRDERTEQGWRQMVRLYEGMRPRDAAGIFDELDMLVLIQVVDRMREARAAPVLAAMRPERARLVTTELARHRSRPLE